MDFGKSSLQPPANGNVKTDGRRQKEVRKIQEQFKIRTTNQDKLNFLAKGDFFLILFHLKSHLKESNSHVFVALKIIIMLSMNKSANKASMSMKANNNVHTGVAFAIPENENLLLTLKFGIKKNQSNHLVLFCSLYNSLVFQALILLIKRVVSFQKTICWVFYEDFKNNVLQLLIGPTLKIYCR